jgi:hypothetical protein
MKLKLKILTSFLLLSSASFSQTDTSRVCLPYQTAKKVAIDLIEGDRAKQELSLTKEVLNLTNTKVDTQEAVITELRNKEEIYLDQLKVKDQQLTVCTEYNKAADKKIKRLTVTKKVLAFSVGFMTVVALVGFIAH